MTLTRFRNNAWADSATDAPKHDGLTPFGVQVVKEMQRLGMLVGLAHVSEATMRDVLALGGPPPIVSHSNARAINHHSRNVSDETLRQIGAAGGIVMVNFYPPYVVEAARQWSAARDAEAARAKALNRVPRVWPMQSTRICTRSSRMRLTSASSSIACTFTHSWP